MNEIFQEPALVLVLTGRIFAHASFKEGGPRPDTMYVIGCPVVLPSFNQDCGTLKRESVSSSKRRHNDMDIWYHDRETGKRLLDVEQPRGLLDVPVLVDVIQRDRYKCPLEVVYDGIDLDQFLDGVCQR